MQFPALDPVLDKIESATTIEQLRAAVADLALVLVDRTNRLRLQMDDPAETRKNSTRQALLRSL